MGKLYCSKMDCLEEARTILNGNALCKMHRVAYDEERKLTTLYLGGMPRGTQRKPSLYQCAQR